MFPSKAATAASMIVRSWSRKGRIVSGAEARRFEISPVAVAGEGFERRRGLDEPVPEVVVAPGVPEVDGQDRWCRGARRARFGRYDVRDAVYIDIVEDLTAGSRPRGA